MTSRYLVLTKRLGSFRLRVVNEAIVGRGKGRMIVKQYTPLVISEQELTDELDKLWGELKKTDSLTSRKAAEQGFPIAELRNMERAEVIEVKTEGAGVGVLDTVIVVVLLPLAMKAAEKLTEKVVEEFWERIVVPWIRHRKGEDVLKEKS